MDIDGLGDALVDQLLARGLVHSVADLYQLTVPQLLELERMGEKSATKIIKNIEKSRSQPLARRVEWIGHSVRWRAHRPTAGRTFWGSRRYCRRFSSKQLEEVNEVGPKVAESIRQFFGEKQNRQLLEALRAAGLQFKGEKQAKKSGPLSGLTFVITGTLPSLKREEAKARIEEAGGKVAGSVSTQDELSTGRRRCRFQTR